MSVKSLLKRTRGGLVCDKRKPNKDGPTRFKDQLFSFHVEVVISDMYGFLPLCRARCAKLLCCLAFPGGYVSSLQTVRATTGQIITSKSSLGNWGVYWSYLQWEQWLQQLGHQKAHLNVVKSYGITKPWESPVQQFTIYTSLSRSRWAFMKVYSLYDL